MAEKSAFREIINSVIPDNIRLYSDYVVSNLFATAPAEITEEHFSEGVMQVIDLAVQNAKKKGNKSVGYGDYPPLKSGLSALDIANHNSEAREKVYPGGWQTPISALKLGIDSFDPVLAAVTSLGKFDFEEGKDGYVHVKDKYDFNNIREKDGATDVYRKVRSTAPVGKEKGTPVNVRYNAAPYRVVLPTPRPKRDGILDQMASLFSSEASASNPVRLLDPEKQKLPPLPTEKPKVKPK
jgi:hypothetical protein